MRCRLSVLTLVLLLAAGAAVAQTISGRVASLGGELAGVAVLIEVNGRRFGETATDAQGRFSVDLPVATGRRDVQLTFTRAGFVVSSHLLEQAALGRALDVLLMPASGPASLSDDEQKMLKALVSNGAGPLLFAPYALPGNIAPTAGASVNERLRVQLQRLILTHVQTAVPVGDTRSVVLAPLPLSAPADLQRLRAMGEYINALAIVSGQGFPEGATAGGKLALESQYLIIPRTSAFDPPVLNIADTVPTESIGRMSLDSRMSRMWGRATVLALAARDLRSALALNDPSLRTAELKRIQQYLFTERSNVGAQDELGEAKLKQLLDLVARELKQ